MDTATESILAYFKNKTILITGGNGYLANNLIIALASVECTILRLSRKQIKTEQTKGACKIVDVQGDLRTQCGWEEMLEGINAVYHLAAQTSTYAANESP